MQPRAWNWRKLRSLLLLVYLCLMFCCVYQDLTSSLSGWLNAFVTSRRPTKTILFYTPFFAQEDWGFGEGREPFSVCPVSECSVTRNRSSLPSLTSFDAVMFHMRDLGPERIDELRDLNRSQSQRYIMFLMESPVHDYFPYNQLEGYFNWTMTYRLDSDIPNPYGFFAEKTSIYEAFAPQTPPAREPDQWKISDIEELSSDPDLLKLARRPKLVAWAVSNCHTESKREKYIQELNRYIPVDAFGSCGNVTCTNTTEACERYIADNYKFYLAFENSLCNQYVTEKFFGRVKRKLVPVVLGQANYSHIAPPDSFIDAQSFASPRHLAEHLLRLNSSDDDYLKHFAWKKNYRVTGESLGPTEPGMCRLCEMLHGDLFPKTYERMTSWWREGGQCKQPDDILWQSQGH